MAYTFRLTDDIPASPEAIYAAWLDSRGHTDMTGGKAEVSPTEGGAFTAWDGYIVGRTVELVPDERIVQSWRTTRFRDDQPDSRITVALSPIAGGTRLTLTHENVPEDHTGYEQGGWQEHYFEPMKKYFAARDRN